MYSLKYCKPNEFDALKTDDNIVIEVKMEIGDIKFNNGIVIEGYKDVGYEELIKSIDNKGNHLIAMYSRAISGRRDLDELGL